MISDERVQKAMTYLAETDEPAAKAKAYLTGIEDQEKTILAIEFLKTQGTVAEREALSRSSLGRQEWQDRHKEAVYDYEILRNKRKTEELIVEVWRSIQANRRAGNI